MILEAIPHQLATYITSSLVPSLEQEHSPPALYYSTRGDDYPLATLPTIGIGAGPGTSGQVLVQDDMLGFWIGHRPKFVRQFLPPAPAPAPSPSPPSATAESPIHATSIGDLAVAATKAYVRDVQGRKFPSIERGETYDMDPNEWEFFLQLVKAEEAVLRNGNLAEKGSSHQSARTERPNKRMALF